MAKIKRTVQQFLPVFQKQMLSFTPHKHHHHWQNAEIAKLMKNQHFLLNKNKIASFFDYNQN